MPHLFSRSDVHNQWVSARTPLGRKHARHGLIVARVRTQAVHSLSRKRDQSPFTQNARGPLDRFNCVIRTHAQTTCLVRADAAAFIAD